MVKLKFFSWISFLLVLPIVLASNPSEFIEEFNNSDQVCTMAKIFNFYDVNSKKISEIYNYNCSILGHLETLVFFIKNVAIFQGGF